MCEYVCWAFRATWFGYHKWSVQCLTGYLCELPVTTQRWQRMYVGIIKEKRDERNKCMGENGRQTKVKWWSEHWKRKRKRREMENGKKTTMKSQQIYVTLITIVRTRYFCTQFFIGILRNRFFMSVAWANPNHIFTEWTTVTYKAMILCALTRAQKTTTDFLSSTEPMSKPTAWRILALWNCCCSCWFVCLPSAFFKIEYSMKQMIW